MRSAVNISGYQKPVPVHGRVNVERILDCHLHLIVPAQADNWPKDGTRIAIGPRRLARDECVPSGRDFQFYRVSLFGSVDQRRNRQAPGEVHRLALGEMSAGNAANEAA
jgi:hypothetical protein